MSDQSMKRKLYAFATILGAGLAALGLMLCLASCSPGGNSASGSAATASPSGTAASGGNANQGASGSSDAGEIDGSAFVGSWELAETELSDGTVVGPEELDGFRAQGLESFLVLSEDGSAVQAAVGHNYYGKWEATHADIGVADIAGVRYTLELGKTTLVASIGGTAPSIYRKTDDIAVMSEEEYEAAKEAFTGTWYIYSASRDGMTISIEDGQVSPDAAMVELTSDMNATITVGGNTSPEARWGITDSSTGYIINPVDGMPMTLSDGYLTLDFGGGNDIMTFTKE